jgi:catechol 2,3-dioxygenase-like lactoylglutathione lyase family enzyme
MRIRHTSVVVDDQQEALRFYTEVLGFRLKHNIPLGEYSWITVVSEEEPEGTELVLEPAGHPAVVPYRKALVEDGIPFTAFTVDDVEAEHERLMAKGVRFLQPPTDLGTVVTAVFDDSSGNLIQIMEQKDQP